MGSLESDHGRSGLSDLVLLRTRLESFEVAGAHLALAGWGAEDEVTRCSKERGLYGGRYQ